MLQTKFSQGPYFEQPQPILTIKMKHLGKSITTRKVFTKLFRDIWAKLHRCYSKGQKGTFTDNIALFLNIFCISTEAFSFFRYCQKTAAITVLAEDHSMRSYHWKRMLQCFETPSKRSRTNVTKTLTWLQQSKVEQAVLEDLQAQPSAPPAINWQKFVQEHNVHRKHFTTVLKHGFNTFTTQNFAFMLNCFIQHWWVKFTAFWPCVC